MVTRWTIHVFNTTKHLKQPKGMELHVHALLWQILGPDLNRGINKQQVLVVLTLSSLVHLLIIMSMVSSWYRTAGQVLVVAYPMRYSLRELIFWCSTSYASWKFFTDLSAAVSGTLLVGTSCREGGKGPVMVVERLWKEREEKVQLWR